MIKKTRRECIDCGICTKNCLFLEKYNINLREFTYREDLPYHCFMCGKCHHVCPKDLSGTKIALEMRQNAKEGIAFTKWMKDPYKLRNLPKKSTKDLLYLGCNYPGNYPETCDRLIDICKDYGVDFSVDCCKKPVFQSGEETNQSDLEKLILNKGIERIITTCPNCYHLLKGKISAEVISIYQFLAEKEIGEKIQGEISIFFPCSDRYNREIFQWIQTFIEDYKEDYYEVNCCGLGGGASHKEEGIVQETMDRIRTLQKGDLYTYCASCSGIFHKNSIQNVRNILSEIIGVHEKPSDYYGKNVIRYKFKRR